MPAPTARPAATVDDVLSTTELSRRPSRRPDYQAESRALVELAAVMADSPDRVLQKLADTALELCRAGSAGVSVWESGDENVFRWRATAGAYTLYLGNTLPRDFSPCGTVVDRRGAQLMADPVRFYPYIAELSAPVREVLLVPFQQAGETVGTVWVVSHTESRQFDAEDERLVATLSRFAGAAVQTLTRIEAAEASESGRRDVQNRLHVALGAGRMGTWDLDLATLYMTCSDACKANYGRKPGEPFTYQELADAVHEDDRSRWRAAVEDAVARSGELEVEYRTRWPDGTTHWVYVRGNYTTGACGRALSGVSLDVTERKRAEELVRAGEERYRALFNTIDEGFCVIEFLDGPHGPLSDYVHVEANPAYLTNTGIPDIVGQKVREMVPDEAAAWVDVYRDVLVTGRPVRFERELVATGRHLDLAAFRVGPPERRQVAVLFSDVTARKQAEEELRRLAAALSDADRKKDEFLATLAHELRNPLAPIRNGLQVLAMSDRPEARDRAVAMMGRQLGQMVRLVDDLMDVSRVSQGKLELKRERVPLADVLASAVETSRPLIDQMGHELTYLPPDQGIVVDADLTRLAQVFLNLLNNAAKYMERGGRIRLSTVRQGNEVAASVRDAGVGIAADQLPRIFDLFSQVDKSLEKAQGGLGIGLTLVRRLTEMHGGTIEAKSDGPGTGSEFVVRLPVVEAPVPVAGRRDEKSARAAHRILIVDDNQDGADSLSEMMAIFGNETQAAYDGEAAVSAAGEFRPDVTLLDIGLPKLNGYEACRRIRAQSNGTRPVIIAQTGWGADEDRNRTREAGFDHHLVKPVDPAELLKLLVDVGR